MSEDTIRTFVGISIDQTSQHAIDEISKHLKQQQCLSCVRWHEPKNWHITLRFLGKTKQAIIPELIENIQDNIQDQNSFTITLSQPHLFPDFRHPRAVAMHAKPMADLLRLAMAVDKSVIMSGYAPETRAYRPHMTLGKIRGKVSNFIADDQDAFINQSVDKIILYKSEIDGQGAHYTPLHTIPLQGAAA